MARHAQREFVLAHEHLAGILPLEELRLFLAMGTHDRLDARVERARDLSGRESRLVPARPRGTTED